MLDIASHNKNDKAPTGVTSSQRPENIQRLEKTQSLEEIQPQEKIAMPAHGGDLAWASDTFNIARDAWLDLSTGVSPWSWPVSDIPVGIWRHLPQSDKPLRQAAAAYYDCPLENLVAIPGSQFAINHIPLLAPVGAVAIPRLGYAEHRQAWQRAGHRIYCYSNGEQLEQLVDSKQVRYVVTINPNNPSSEILTQDFLIRIQCSLENHWGVEGLLLIDEAFMDLTPQHPFWQIYATCAEPS